MGLMDSRSRYPLVAVVTLGIAFFLYLVSFGAPQWCETDSDRVQAKEHIGLWRYCTYPVGGGQSCDDFIDIVVGDWLKAAQSFMTLALFSFLGALGITVVYAFVPDFAADKRIFGGAVAVIGATFLFLLIGVTTMGMKCEEYFINRQPMWEGAIDFGWAWYLALVSMILTFIAIVLLVLDVASPEED